MQNCRKLSFHQLHFEENCLHWDPKVKFEKRKCLQVTWPEKCCKLYGKTPAMEIFLNHFSENVSTLKAFSYKFFKKISEQIFYRMSLGTASNLGFLWFTLVVLATVFLFFFSIEICYLILKTLLKNLLFLTSETEVRNYL